MFEVCVPATSANLACGFDVLGLALNLFYRVEVSSEGEGFHLYHQGEGEGKIKEEDNLFFRAVRRTWEEVGFPEQGMRVKAFNEIPISRGLGSSAACIVAGVISANEVMGRVLNLSQMIEVASQIEGHSDNVVPAFLGGFTIALLREGRIFYHQLPFLREVEMVVCIPDYTLSTEEMRKVLPSSYPRDKVVFTLSSLAYLLGSIFTGDKEGFFLSLEDEIHQPYRGAKIKGFSKVKEYIQKRNLGNVAISGSGPALILFLSRSLEAEEEKDLEEIFQSRGVNVEIKKVEAVEDGARVRKL